MSSSPDTLQNDFVQKTKLIRERLDSRTEETLGGWFTEEALRKSGKYSNTSVKAIIKYCKKFPEPLCRPVNTPSVNLINDVALEGLITHKE